MVSDGIARLLLLLHLVSALAVIGLTTHFAIWLRRYVHGRHGLRRAVVKFGTWSALAYVVAFALGNVVYPTYKVRVRLEYLEDSTHVAAAKQMAAERRMAVAQRLAPGSPDAAMPAGGVVVAPAHGAHAAAIARLFDTKEHWVALGMFLSLASAWLVRRWRADSNDVAGGDPTGPYLLWFAYGAAGAAWYGGIVGALTSIWRAV